MPGLNGLEALVRLHQLYPQVQVVVLSMHANEEYVLRALRAGARSYLLKDASTQDLLATVRAAGRGERLLCPPLSEEIVAGYAQNTQPETSPIERLTPREREILQLLAQGHTTQGCAHILRISPKTVETHRANLMDKLKIYDIAGLTRFALRCGLLHD